MGLNSINIVCLIGVILWILTNWFTDVRNLCEACGHPKASSKPINNTLPTPWRKALLMQQ
jgi:hypothetical protein